MNALCRCNLLHLIDKRFQGIARGVGEQKIMGRIHAVRRLPCFFAFHLQQPWPWHVQRCCLVLGSVMWAHDVV